jgi:hypothetical protein
MKYYLILALSFSVFFSCGKKEKEYSRVANSNTEHAVTVEQVQNAGGYTYLLVEEDGESYWIAVSKDDFEAGDKLYFTSFVEMKDFKSKELDKTFDQILFVDWISSEPGQMKAEKESTSSASPHKRNQVEKMLDSIKIDPAPGGISIGQLYRDAEKYKDKEVIVSGQVVKINNGIMDRNWVHIMDGTRGDRSDLTFTTTSDFQMGDTVTIKGKVAVDKDFGGGYVYPLIVEEADLVN